MDQIFIIIGVALVFPFFIWLFLMFGFPGILAIKKSFEHGLSWWERILYFWQSLLSMGASIIILIGPILEHGAYGLTGMLLGVVAWTFIFKVVL